MKSEIKKRYWVAYQIYVCDLLGEVCHQMGDRFRYGSRHHPGCEDCQFRLEAIEEEITNGSNVQ